MAYLPPEEWNNDNRMNFMFSAFPENRDANSKHWDSKLQFWQTAIFNSSEASDDMFINVSVLKSRFRRNGVSPLGLGTVVKEMLRCGEIVSSREFLDSVYDSWGSWSYGVAKKTFWWSVAKVWQDDSEPINGSFVLLAVVKKKAVLVVSCHYQTVKHSLTDNLVPVKVLKARLQANNLNLSDEELDIIICLLRKEGKLSVRVLENGEKVLKFADKNEQKVSPISETDLNILRLKKEEASIQLQIKKLQKDIDELQSIAVMSVKQGLQNKAEKILSRKHMLSKTLDKKESLLLNTQDILRRIQDAHSDSNVIEALKAGAQVFKTISQESGLTIDNVEKIMTEVEEVMDDAAEIDRTISEGVSKTLDKKESLLLNTQDILRRIQDAHSDSNVIEALKAGAQVFKTISQESGLTIDNVEKIMTEVEEVMDDAAEIDRTISEGSRSVAAISGSPEEDIEDLEKELEDLLVEEEEEEEEAKDFSMPEVPTHVPVRQESNKERRPRREIVSPVFFDIRYTIQMHS